MLNREWISGLFGAIGSAIEASFIEKQALIPSEINNRRNG